MNAITKALYEIREAIPVEVLDIAFKEKNQKLNTIISLDERITNMVIRPRVMVDSNLVGGVQIRVDISKCVVGTFANGEYVVEIPKDLTGGKSIVSVLSLVSNVIYQQSVAYSDMSASMASSTNAMNNLGNETIVQTSRLELLGDNIVLVQDPMMHLMFGILRCNVENSKNMENLHPRSYHAFAKACVLATKAKIYTSLRIKLDQGHIYGGHELGSVKETVDSYSDANDMYLEYINGKYKKVLFMNNSDSVNRFIKSMLSNTL